MPKPIKVLTLNVSDSSGGAARAAYRIHKSIQSLGLDAKMLVKNKVLKDNSVIQLTDFESLFLLSKPYSFVTNKFKNKLQHYQWSKYPKKEDVFLSDLRSVSLNGALQKIDFDILHLHWINLRFLDLRELRKLNKPIVWTLHDCWPFTGICHYFYECDQFKHSCGNCPFLHSNIENDLSARVWSKKAKYYKDLNLHIVSPSHWLATSARESSLLRQFPVSVIPNPIDTEYFSSGEKMEACDVLGISSKKKYILYGAMNAVNDKRKGFREFCEAMQYFENSFIDTQTEVLIFGCIEQPDMGLDIIPINYLGVLQDERLLAAYRAADVMIVPSLYENLSNIILESLSCGTPVVAFDIGGNADMIEHKVNGYLSTPNQAKSLAEGVFYCLSNNFDNELSTAASEKVKASFNSDIVGDMYLKVYQDIVNNHIN